MTVYQFELFADYYQFHIQDELAEDNLGNSWTQDAVDRLLAIAPGIVGVGTVRNMNVPVTLEICETEPETCFDDWDRVNECSLEVKSGKIVIAGCTDYFPDAARIEIQPGTYRVRIYYKNLKNLNKDGLNGNDQYRVMLWPDTFKEVVVLKPYVKN
ncbi:hypothetical protein CKA32_005400 [Geitlerinema sp. FC II]|nr:hypothetical protein [Geitlerinema sp. CS-897]PPT09718.1 hypothetical protein CKA32_005400 [Geitlerinema sp. FC II]